MPDQAFVGALDDEDVIRTARFLSAVTATP